MNKSTKILIIVSRFNEMVTKCLLEGALTEAERRGFNKQDVTIIWVPGAFEIPTVASKAAGLKKYHAIVCLGCVIRGETPHFDIVSGESAAGLMRVAISNSIPIINGVLTTNTVEQAMNRSGLKYGNKGSEAMTAALEMIATMQQL